VHILENVLFGSVLTVSGNDLLVLAIVGSLVMALALPLYNRIMLASFNPQLAAVRGVAVKTLDYLFVILVTLITVAAVKVIGAILVGALLVIPAAAARLLSQSLKGFFWCSVLIATVSTLCGILAADHLRPADPVRRRDHSGRRHRLRPRRHCARGCSESEREPWINDFLLRKLTLAMTLCGVVGSPLLAAENPQPLRVLASLPITYGLGEVLLKGTDVSLERAAPANLPGSRQTAYFTGRGAPALGNWQRCRCGDRRALAVGG
jgi:hypothetical protein